MILRGLDAKILVMPADFLGAGIENDEIMHEL